MLRYEQPNVEIVRFSEEDVITSSATFTTTGIYEKGVFEEISND